MEQMDMEFYVKSRGGRTRHTGRSDVQLTFSRRPNKKDMMYITFRNQSSALIAPNTEHIGVGIKGTRMYFKEFDKAVGYKLTINTHNKTKNAYLKVPVSGALLEFAKEHEGNYDLVTDKNSGLYYIETGIIFFTKEEQ